jgi:putative phage-type endonuclease
VNAPLANPTADRSRFLGGSDAAAVIGVSPYATPVELWMQKTGRMPKGTPDAAQEKRFARGHRLEPFIRDMVIDKLQSLGLQVELVACNERYVDPEFPFLSCEIDFELVLTGEMAINGAPVVFDGERVNCDAKSVAGFARKKWGEVDTEDVPIEYAAQFMHGLMITGRQRCLVAALRSFDDVDIFWTLRDDETIAAMRPKLVEFWVNHVQADVPPDPMRFEDIKALFPLDNGEATEATEDIADKVEQLRDIKAQIKVYEEAEEALRFEIAQHISPNARLVWNGRDIATWKAQNDTRLDQKLLAAAEIYRRDATTGEFTPITNPVAEFTRTKAVRVLRLPSPKKGKQ